MQFTKMHGAGNDYVYVNTIDRALAGDVPELARRISDRRFGVGADGLILLGDSDIADARMIMYNADGSQAEMCGNGIRCLAKLIYDRGICRKPHLSIETGAGVLAIELQIEQGQIHRVCVDMGEPILQAASIPTRLPGNPVVNATLPMADRQLVVTCVSMGNPHCVIFVEQLEDDDVLGLGPLIEVDPHFPSRVNVEFVQIISPAELRQRTWERGSGETLGCGTGASAVCVAGVLTKQTLRQVRVHLSGGDLDLDWNEEDNHVYMTGPAEEVFTGVWPHS